MSKKIIIALTMSFPLLLESNASAQIYQQPDPGFLNNAPIYQRHDPSYSRSIYGEFQQTPAAQRSEPVIPSPIDEGSGTSCSRSNCP